MQKRSNIISRRHSNGIDQDFLAIFDLITVFLLEFTSSSCTYGVLWILFLFVHGFRVGKGTCHVTAFVASCASIYFGHT